MRRSDTAALRGSNSIDITAVSQLSLTQHRPAPSGAASVRSLRDRAHKLAQSPFYDAAMRCPVPIFLGSLLLSDMNGFYRQLAPDWLAHLSAGMIFALLARIWQWLFVAALAIQPLFRLRPIAKSKEMLPRLAALLAVGLPAAFLLLPRAPPSLPFNLLALTISLVANVLAVVTLRFLGRSLSVMPEARRLVQSGPYRLVRHPLYLCELFATLAVFLQYRTPLALALLATAAALQVKRAGWEEQVLARAFPDFAAYRAKTAFLIPRPRWRSDGRVSMERAVQ